MPRGRSPHYPNQRELILRHAADLFATQGYSATSMNQVAQACGLSKPTLYHYTRDKYHLLVDITETHIARLQKLVEEVSALNLAPEACVREMIRRFVLEYAGAQAQHRVLTEDVKYLEPADRRRVLDGERRVVACFAEAIALARPEASMVPISKALSMLLFGMMNWMFTWLKPEGALTHADMAPIVADLFFGGLGAIVPPAQREHLASAA